MNPARDIVYKPSSAWESIDRSNASPVKKLPPEILQQIFEIFQQTLLYRLGSDNRSWNPYLPPVTSVCKVWRYVAIGHSRLWSAIEVHRGRHVEPPIRLSTCFRIPPKDQTLDAIETIIHRCRGNVSLRIDIGRIDDEKPSDHERTLDFFQIMFSRPEIITIMEIKSEIGQCAPSFLTNLPRLRELTMRSVPHDPFNRASIDAEAQQPHYSLFTIDDPALSRIGFFSELEVLSISRKFLDAFHEALPNLDLKKIVKIRLESGYGQDQVMKAFALVNTTRALKSIQWDFVYETEPPSFSPLLSPQSIPRLSLPHLTDLSIQSASDDWYSSNLVDASKIEHLRLHGVFLHNYDPQHFVDILYESRGLKTFSLPWDSVMKYPHAKFAGVKFSKCLRTLGELVLFSIPLPLILQNQDEFIRSTDERFLPHLRCILITGDGVPEIQSTDDDGRIHGERRLPVECNGMYSRLLESNPRLEVISYMRSIYVGPRFRHERFHEMHQRNFYIFNRWSFDNVKLLYDALQEGKVEDWYGMYCEIEPR